MPLSDDAENPFWIACLSGRPFRDHTYSLLTTLLLLKAPRVKELLRSSPLTKLARVKELLGSLPSTKLPRLLVLLLRLLPPKKPELREGFVVSLFPRRPMQNKTVARKRQANAAHSKAKAYLPIVAF